MWLTDTHSSATHMLMKIIGIQVREIVKLLHRYVLSPSFDVVLSRTEPHKQLQGSLNSDKSLGYKYCTYVVDVGMKSKTTLPTMCLGPNKNNSYYILFL
jgi:hypothetical protein